MDIFGGESKKIRLFRKPCGSCPGRQGEALRSVQARRAAVATDGPAPAPPIPHMAGVLRSVHACYTRCISKSNGYPRPGWSGLARATAAHTSGAPPQGRVSLVPTASCVHPGTAWSFRCASGWWPGSLRLRASAGSLVKCTS